MTLPTDTRGQAAGSSFTKFEAGATELLLLPTAITGYQYFTKPDAAGKKTCVRSPEVFAEPIADIAMRSVKDKDGNIVGEEPEKQQFYWAMPVYNYRTQAFEIAQLTQKGIRDDLLALKNNPAGLGDPTGQYTITVTKTGEKLQTRYRVDGNPLTEEKKTEIAGIIAKFNENPINVSDTLFGSSTEETTEETATATPAPAEATPAAAPATEAPAAPAPQAAPATPAQ